MKHELYTVSQRSPDRLIIKRKRARFLWEALFLMVFTIAWIGGLIRIPYEGTLTEQLVKLASNLFFWPFLLMPFYFLYQIFQNIWRLVTGDSIVIDKTQATITRNKETAIGFTDVDFLQIRKYTDSDRGTDYRLSVAKTDGEKMFIDRSSNRDEIIEMAEEIGDFISKEIRFKA